MPTIEPDTRSPERKALDEAIAAEPHEPAPPIPPGTPLRPIEEFLRDGGPVAEAARPRMLAGFVLALLVFCSHGSTGPWAVVLGLEWLADRRRCPHASWYDTVSVMLGGLGSALFVLESLTILAHIAPSGVIGYWATFAVWVVVRMFTRWRDIAADRRRLPSG